MRSRHVTVACGRHAVGHFLWIASPEITWGSTGFTVGALSDPLSSVLVMSSTTRPPEAPVTVRGLARRVEALRDAATAVTDAMAADPALLAEVPDELLEAFTADLHRAVDAASAAATVVTGRLERQIGSVRGKLIANRYPSTARFLERALGMSTAQARATVARGRDLDTHSTRVADAWLTGAITGGTVRDLTAGVTEVIRRSTRYDTPVARGEALDHLLPIAAAGDATRLSRAVGEMRLRLDPDGTTEEALFAHEHQHLSIVECGSMFRISGWLSPETAIATTTVLEATGRRIAEQQLGGIDHDEDCEHLHHADADCTCGATDRARRLAGLRPDQLHAHALGEVMRSRLDNAELGSHHRVAPHITVVADVTDAAAPLMGRALVPGSDDEVLIGEQSLNRLLCDADITRVLTTTRSTPNQDTAATTLPAARETGALDADTDIDDCAGAGARAAIDAPDTRATDYLAAVVTTLEVMARRVLYVGRTERTVTARLRRALEVRDGHCVFSSCRARVSRCHAHHVVPWHHHGPTDLPNLALLCPTHHVAVHEGGWTMSLRPGATGHETDCWQFTEPPTRRRRTRP